MESELVIIAVGGLVSLISELLKKTGKFENVNSLVIVAALSVLGGSAYAYLLSQGIWETVKEQVLLVFSSAVAIYNVLSAITKATKS